MSKRSRRSKRKLNSLFMMLLLTGMLLVTSTYAWFSSSKEVLLDGINAKVVAAEGLQISLDGEVWSSTITINESKLQELAGKNNYVWPEALTPVSTVGASSNGNIDMFWGEVSSDGTTLNNAATDPETGKKYIVFDLYFKNSSSQTTDKLQLNSTSLVQIADDGVENTGLENCIRTGIVLYENTAVMTESGENIRGLTPGNNPLVSIWEPNYNKHISLVVKNDPRLEGNGSSEFVTLGLKGIGDGTVTGINAETADDENAFLAAQNTVRTSGTVAEATDMTAVDGSTVLQLKQNSIMKSRIYIWLEGQDPDCIDTASTGKSIDVVLGFTKPSVTTPDSGET